MSYDLFPQIMLFDAHAKLIPTEQVHYLPSATSLFLIALIRFNENIMTDPGFVDIYPASRIPKDMQHHFKPIYRSTPSASEEIRDLRDQKREKGLQITTDSSTLSSVLKWVSDAEVSLLIFGL